MRSIRGYYDKFVQTCTKTPLNIAVRHYDGEKYKNYTYSELYGACEYISQCLLQILTCKKGVIGLVSERNILIPCIIAAAHKCCTTFMFIDPVQNIEEIEKNINFNIIIIIWLENDDSTERSLLRKKPEKTITIFNLNIGFYNMIPSNNSNYHLKHANEHSYIAMTSGSTGEPKHIQVPLQSLQPNIDDLTKLFNIGSKDIIYFSTPLTFDPSMVEILLACENGASLLIAPERTDVLFPYNKENAVTFWQTTPSKFFQHSDDEIKNIILGANSPLKILALGGEPLNGIMRLKKLKNPNNHTKIFTLYGVTEMSCWACAAELDLNKITSDREIPLGNCLSETKVLVEPSNTDNTNSGKIILISKTRKCIVLSHSGSIMEQNSLKFVDTGDLAEVREGIIYYTGRTDDIVKRFGHKVNLQLIDSTIMESGQVKACSCIWLSKPMLLVVYYSSETMSSQKLAEYLKCKLSENHWPDKILHVENLPTSVHGKTSRKILSRIFENTALNNQSIDCLKSEFLKEVNIVLGKNFSYDYIQNKSFFSLGGSSFIALAMCNKLSLAYPLFGKFILPYLISQNHIIDDILSMAEKELTSEGMTKKRLKRARSNTTSTTGGDFKKINSVFDSPINFLVSWTYDTRKCVDASPTLLKVENDVYVTVGSHSGILVVIDAISGTLRGKISLKSRIEAPIMCTQNECMREPCGIVGTYDGTVICFALQNCAEIWRSKVGAMVKSKAICCNGLVYIASYDGYVRCLDALTGVLKHEIHITDQAISADLVLAKNQYIMLGTLSGVCACIETTNNNVSWRGVVGSPIFATPALYDYDKYVVFTEVSGEIHCWTVEKGIKIWRYQGAKGNVFSSLFIKQIDTVKWLMFFGCHDNHVYSIVIKNFQPSLRWKTRLSSPVYATPCGLSQDHILAASNDGTLCILDVETGVVLTDHHLPDETFSSPAVYDDYIFIGCRDDHLYCLKFILNR